MFVRFKQAGIAIAGIDVGESFGSPDGSALYSALYDELTQHRGFAAKPVLLGRSRGGLMTLSWAAVNADKVAGFAGIYPVCNLVSYLGISNACVAYRMTSDELSAQLAEHNPIDRLAALAKAHLPMFSIQGDSDKTVPLEANSGEMRKRYEALGGEMEIIVPPGQGHNLWEGFFTCQELVDFAILHATQKQIVLSSPLDYQVVQRRTKSKGNILITGALVSPRHKKKTLQARFVENGTASKWQNLDVVFQETTFRGMMELPVGGWYRLELRASIGGEFSAETAVDHVGVGEVFVVAGQSNSANHGEERQTPKTGKVVTFDGLRCEVPPSFDTEKAPLPFSPVGVIVEARRESKLRLLAPGTHCGDVINIHRLSVRDHMLGDPDVVSSHQRFQPARPIFALVGVERFFVATEKTSEIGDGTFQCSNHPSEHPAVVWKPDEL